VASGACRNQETAFWLLAALVEDILAPGTYDPHLMGCLVSKAGWHLRKQHMWACNCASGAMLLAGTQQHFYVQNIAMCKFCVQACVTIPFSACPCRHAVPRLR
jgi:hypothetical protein